MIATIAAPFGIKKITQTLIAGIWACLKFNFQSVSCLQHFHSIALLPDSIILLPLPEWTVIRLMVVATMLLLGVASVPTIDTRLVLPPRQVGYLRAR